MTGFNMRARIPDSTPIVLRGCGHAPMLERVRAFGTVTRAWLDDARMARAVR
jgi:pimeloyl-ACP methyl ester carboxylesterase